MAPFEYKVLTVRQLNSQSFPWQYRGTATFSQLGVALLCFCLANLAFSQTGAQSDSRTRRLINSDSLMYTIPSVSWSRLHLAETTMAHGSLVIRPLRVSVWRCTLLDKCDVGGFGRDLDRCEDCT